MHGLEEGDAENGGSNASKCGHRLERDRAEGTVWRSRACMGSGSRVGRSRSGTSCVGGESANVDSRCNSWRDSISTCTSEVPSGDNRAKAARRNIAIKVELRNGLPRVRKVTLRRKRRRLLPQEDGIAVRSIGLIGIWGSIGSYGRLGDRKHAVRADGDTVNEPMACRSGRGEFANRSWIDHGKGEKVTQRHGGVCWRNGDSRNCLSVIDREKSASADGLTAVGHGEECKWVKACKEVRDEIRIVKLSVDGLNLELRVVRRVLGTDEGKGGKDRKKACSQHFIRSFL